MKLRVEIVWYVQTPLQQSTLLCLNGNSTYYGSGVFSTGATGAIAPVILRKRLIAPVILPGMFPKGRNFEDDLNK